MCAFAPSRRAARATARPWLPSVAATSVSDDGSRPRTAHWAAQNAPSALNAGSPKRALSSLSSTRPTPSSAATGASSCGGVGA
jgi:hypothetical protein